jgi:transposase-like protein
VERKWKEGHPQKFRRGAVERMAACENVVRLAREIGVSHSPLYKWRHRLEVFAGEFFQRGKYRLLLVILGNIEPHACVYQEVEPGLFFLFGHALPLSEPAGRAIH